MLNRIVIFSLAIIAFASFYFHEHCPELLWTYYANMRIGQWSKQFSESQIKKTCGSDPRAYYNCFYNKLVEFESQNEWMNTPGAFLTGILYMKAGAEAAMAGRNQLKTLRNSPQDSIDAGFQILHIMHWTGSRVKNLNGSSTQIQNEYDQKLEVLARKYDVIVFNVQKQVNALPNSPLKVQYLQRLQQYGGAGESNRQIASQ